MIVRVKKRSRYAIISNVPLNDERLSWEARGLLAWLLSKPDDWEVNLGAIKRYGLAGRDKVTRMFSELSNVGYLVRIKIRRDDGRFGWDSVVYEEPVNQHGKTGDGLSLGSPVKPSMVTPFTDKRSMAELSAAEPPILNTDSPMTDGPNTERPNTDAPISAHTRVNPNRKKKAPPASQTFEEAWRIFPRRAEGINSRNAGLLAWRETIQQEQDDRAEDAQLIEEELEEEMLDGVLSYRDYIAGSDDVGTRWVMEFKTFFGNAKHWEERSWESADRSSVTHPAYNTGALERLKRDGMQLERKREAASGESEHEERDNVGGDGGEYNGE